MLELTYINAGITSATTSMATRLWLYSVSIAMIAMTKSFSRALKKWKKKKGKEKLEIMECEKKGKFDLGIAPFTLLQECLNSHVMADYVTAMLCL